MNNWEIAFYPEAKKDLERLDGSLKKQVLKVIYRVAKNPLPNTQGGYGKPLSGALSGFCKIKLKDSGLRIIYELRQKSGKMEIVIIGFREDSEVYQDALHRIKQS